MYNPDMDGPKCRKSLKEEEEEQGEDVDRYSESHAISAPPKFVRDHKQSERGRGKKRRRAWPAFDNRFTIMRARPSCFDVIHCKWSSNFKAKTLLGNRRLRERRERSTLP